MCVAHGEQGTRKIRRCSKWVVDQRAGIQVVVVMAGGREGTVAVFAWAVQAENGNLSGAKEADYEEADEDDGDNERDIVEDDVEGRVLSLSRVIVVSKPFVSRLQS